MSFRHAESRLRARTIDRMLFLFATTRQEEHELAYLRASILVWSWQISSTESSAGFAQRRWLIYEISLGTHSFNELLEGKSVDVPDAKHHLASSPHCCHLDLHDLRSSTARVMESKADHSIEIDSARWRSIIARFEYLNGRLELETNMPPGSHLLRFSARTINQQSLPPLISRQSQATPCFNTGTSGLAFL